MNYCGAKITGAGDLLRGEFALWNGKAEKWLVYFL